MVTPYLLAGVAVHIGLSVLLHQIALLLQVVSEDPRLDVGEGDGDGVGRHPAGGRAVGQEIHLVGIALLVLLLEGVARKALHDGLAGGDDAVLHDP